MFRKLLLTAAVAVAAALVAPATSKADFILNLSETGFTSVSIDFTSLSAGTYIIDGLTIVWTPSVKGGSATVNGTFGDYSLSINGDSFSRTKVITIENETATVTSNKDGANPLSLSLGQSFSGVIPNVGITVFNSLASTQLTSTSVLDGISSVTGTNPNVTTPVATVAGSLLGLGSSDTTQATTTTLLTTIGVSNTITINGLNTPTTSQISGDQATDEYSLTTTVISTNNNIPFLTQTPAPSGLIVAATMVPFFGLLRRRLRGMAKETPVSA
jgi:hypothetical protein